MKNSMLAIFMCTVQFAFSQDDRTLLTVGNKDVSVNEFLSIYNKNNTNNVIDKKTMTEYIDLFVNFKLKVVEAESLGMDTVLKFKSELAGYRRQLAQPYLIDKSMNEVLIKEAYDRTTQDVAAYHILVRVAEDVAPQDTLAALKKLRELSEGISNEKEMLQAIEKVKSLKDKDLIAEDLGYFTTFSMVYPFETAAYSTEVGSMSKPVRTRFGYHVIFVRDKRPARGEIRVSHLFIRSNSEMSDEQRVDANARINEVYQQIKNGGDYETLVKQYSEDRASASKGGNLPWFGTGGTASTFEDAAFNLKRAGDISEPVLSSFGWHIIRKEDARPVGMFEELESSLKKKIEKDSRSLKGRTSLISKLKKDYAISYNNANKNAANKFVGNEYLNGTWKLKAETTEKLDKSVMVISDNVYSKSSKSCTQRDYLEYLQKNQKKLGDTYSLSNVITSHWDGFVESMLIDFEDQNLEAKYPAFKALMREYHDGILLFDLMDDKVWSKAVKDTAGLEVYYKNHRGDFMYPERADATIYNCANSDMAKQTLKLAKKREKKGYSDFDIMEKVDADNPLGLTISSGVFEKDDELAIKASPWMPGLHKVTLEGKPFTYVQIYEIIKPEFKPLYKARGAVTSAYQAELEEGWLKELKSKYDVKINDSVFQEINK